MQKCVLLFCIKVVKIECMYVCLCVHTYIYIYIYMDWFLLVIAYKVCTNTGPGNTDPLLLGEIQG
jgi:hypothetical protein